MESEIIWFIGIVVVFGLIVAGKIRRVRHNKEQNRQYWERKQREDEKEREMLEFVTSLDRGNWAERDLVLELLKAGIPEQAIFHDLYLKKPNGNSTQIDVFVATKVGIIVIEVKDYSGWIFGNANQTNWTQVLSYGREKYRFYNPVMQNKRHITELQKQLRREKVPFYSVIVFYGNCELREINFVPNGTYVAKERRILEVVNEILDSNELATYTDKREVVKVLRTAVKNGDNTDMKNQHIENVRDVLGKDRVFG